MVRMYKRKTTRQSWCEDSMTSAITGILEGKMTYDTATTVYKVPRGTLRNRVWKAKTENLSPVKAAEKGFHHRTIITEIQENEIVQHILTMEDKLFDFTATSDLCELAFQLAERNNIPHSFNKKKQRAGQDWLRKFLDRHKELTPAIMEKISKNRGRNTGKSGLLPSSSHGNHLLPKKLALRRLKDIKLATKKKSRKRKHDKNLPLGEEE